MPFTLPLGSNPPEFSLKGTDKAVYTLKSFADARVLVLFFTCNHCPYVIASDETTRATALKFIPKGVRFVAINSNTPEHYTEDSYENMVARMKKHKFPWTYLHDATQETAKAYGALRTPHFFVFNADRILVYCGRALADPMHPTKNPRNDLEEALNDILAGTKVRVPLTNPVGCTVKWKGQDPHWLPDDACDLV